MLSCPAGRPVIRGRGKRAARSLSSLAALYFHEQERLNMAQTATVTLRDDGIIEVKHGPGSAQFGGYLGKVLKQLNDPKGSQAILMAKARAGDALLDLRKAQQEKSELLAKAAENWETRSRDWSMSPEIRELNADRARKAREEIRKLAVELGG